MKSSKTYPKMAHKGTVDRQMGSISRDQASRNKGGGPSDMSGGTVGQKATGEMKTLKKVAGGDIDPFPSKTRTRKA